MEWERVKLRFAPNLTVSFADRDLALRQIEEIAERGTYPVYVIYGPEGCGKTALFRQVVKVLEALGYSVSMINPLGGEGDERLVTSRDLKEFVSGVLSEITGLHTERLIDLAVELLYRVVRLGRSRRIALLADDVFQGIGLGRAEQLVKKLLNMIEYPSIDYERIVVLISSSEGITRSRVGRHRWANIYILWNMGRDGFRELYSQVPDPKPEFDEVWRLCGGNPWVLSQLYTSGWRVDEVIHRISEGRRLNDFILRLTRKQLEILKEAVNDPDVLVESLREASGRDEKAEIGELIDKLVELNLIIELWDRSYGYIDQPPPERDPELGIGRYYAWQTPLHREALKRTINKANQY